MDRIPNTNSTQLFEYQIIRIIRATLQLTSPVSIRVKSGILLVRMFQIILVYFLKTKFSEKIIYQVGFFRGGQFLL